jgi:hypothetical protein
MTLALYVIGSAFLLVWLSARLREAREELARVRYESGERAQALRDEHAAYAHGAAVTLACLLAGLAAMHWHAPPRPAGAGRDGGPAGGPDREAGR